MSILAAKLDEIRTAAAIAKKLSPAMQVAMKTRETEVHEAVRIWAAKNENGDLSLFAVNAGTTAALVKRELLHPLRSQNEFHIEHHVFTDLGLLVRDILLHGAEAVLDDVRRAAADEVVGQLSKELRDALLTAPDESGLRLAPVGTRNFLARQGLATFYVDSWFSLTDFGILVWRVLSARVSAMRAAAVDALRQVGAELDGAKIDLPVEPAQTESTTEKRSALAEYTAPRDPGTLDSGDNSNPHDYEPGDITHPMATDPNCRICGSTRRDCERRQERVESIDAVDLVAEMPRRTVELHLVLARVANHQYGKTVASGRLHRHEVRPQRAVTQVVAEELSAVHRFMGLGWVRQRPGSIWAGLSLTDLGMKALMVWDGAYTRNDFPQVAVANVGTFVNPLAEGVPPREVLVASPTQEVVRRYPEYYLQGPGRYFAQQVDCEHGYRLTDSCPCC
jgi:hypothetical protein